MNERDVFYVKPRVQELSTGKVSFYDIAEYYSQRSHFAFLDSRLHHNNLGKYSVIAVEPFMIFKSKGNKVWIRRGGSTGEEKTGNIFDCLKTLMAGYSMPPGKGNQCSPFLGGGIGYFAYELGRQLEVLPAAARDVMGIPECYVCFYNAAVIYNHEKEKMFLSYFHPGCDGGVVSPDRLKEEIASIPAGLYRLKGTTPGRRRIPAEDIQARFRSDFTRQDFMDAVNRVKEYILAGDVYQVDVTQRFETDMEDTRPWELYKRLMHINPSPFAAYLNFENVCVVSSSPERFLRINGRHVDTRPMKGTVKRGEDLAEDETNKEFLFHSEKNRAELAMIVDLLRNDLGRVCKPGTVTVKEFPELETYASVHHLVCNVSGELKDEIDTVQVLKAAFPGGSITGAPKIRAMEILDELEPVERGVYTGSIGYLGFNGNADLNIVIRTIVITGKKAHIQAGAGIVADSEALDEYRETLLKARKLFDAFTTVPHDASPTSR